MTREERLEKLLAFHKADPDDTFTRYGIALEYKALGNIEKAVEWLESLRQDAPNYVATYLMLGELYATHKDDADTAADIFRKGMVVAKSLNDAHTFAELQAALEEIE